MTLPESLMPDGEQAFAYLRLLWPSGIPEGGRIAVAFRRGKRGWAARQHSDLARAADDLAAAPDHYLTMAAMRPLDRGRGGEADVVALPGLWLDLDDSRGEHASNALPNPEQALVLLRGLPIPPALVLDSGGGHYAIWPFHAPWVIRDPGERARAKQFSKGWQAFIRARADEHDWHVDETSDLARCLGCAGTLNGKYEPARFVHLIEPTVRGAVARYSPDDFAKYSASDGRHTLVAREVPSSATPQDAGSAPALGLGWLEGVAELLGVAFGRYDDEHGGGVILEVCPVCRGLERAGTIAQGTAHICRRSGLLRCKRATCEAHDGLGGLAVEVWTTRYLRGSAAAGLRIRRAKDHQAHPTLTDDGNAIRLTRRHGDDLRWADGLGWLVWDGRRFRPSPTSRGGISDRAIDYARESARAISREADAPGLSDSQRSAIRAHARDSQSEKSLRSTVVLARCDLGSAADDFDRDPWLLNVNNGTLDLRLGALRPHDRSDMVTKLAPVEYTPDAKSEDLDHFLAHLTRGDSEFLAYVERLLGYTLVGEKSEDLIALLLGPGGTGKSTLLEAFGTMLGDYASVVPFDALRPREQGNGPRPEIAAARGSRLLRASEVREGLGIDAALLKSLCGGDTINVRALYAAPVPFRPTFTLWLAANHPPRLDASDSGSRRRLAVLPFDITVPKYAIDPRLRQRLREPQAARALLACAVRGCNAWREMGTVGTCRAVEDAKLRYWVRDTADVLLSFVDQVCEQVEDAWTSSAALREGVSEYARRQRAAAPSDRVLAEVLRARGFKKADRGSGRGWRLRLRVIPDEVTPSRR